MFLEAWFGVGILVLGGKFTGLGFGQDIRVDSKNVRAFISVESQYN